MLIIIFFNSCWQNHVFDFNDKNDDWFLFTIHLCDKFFNEHVNVFENWFFVQFIDRVIRIRKIFEFEIFIVVWLLIVYDVEINNKSNITKQNFQNFVMIYCEIAKILIELF